MIRKIEVTVGSDIESVVYTLLAAKARGESVYAEFNGHKLYSDTVSMDSAYMEITGQTKADFDKAFEEWRTNYKIEQEEKKENSEKEQEELREKIKMKHEELEKKAKEKIPFWIQRGQEFIFPERYEEWESCVHSVANGVNHGTELDNSLDIMQALENGITMDEAKEMLEGQNHSGSSNTIVRNIMLTFYVKGPEFYEATAQDEILPKNQELIEAKREENLRLAQINSQKDSGSKL